MVAVLLAISIALDASGSFHASGFDATRISPQQASRLFVIRVDAADGPPLIGSYSIRGSEIIFTPRYALQPGLTYRATLTLPHEEAVSRLFTTPAPDMTPTTFVEHVYPSVSTLPENQLKFYIQFSAPMGRGDAYRYIHLLDEAGNPIPLAFLQLTEELWDREAQRFTLFFDPGRIKTGVLPNVRLGLPIREGGKYTLVIDSGWHDSTGRPLKETYRKAFNVGPAERRALDLSAWRIVAPRRATIDPISVEFPKPLDRALLEHEVDVVDSSGKPVDGYVEIDTDETQWSFTPIVRWKPGAYSISVSTVLADLAGNTVDRAFEVDVSEKPRGRQTRTLSFRID